MERQPKSMHVRGRLRHWCFKCAFKSCTASLPLLTDNKKISSTGDLSLSMFFYKRLHSSIGHVRYVYGFVFACIQFFLCRFKGFQGDVNVFIAVGCGWDEAVNDIKIGRASCRE